MSCLPVHGRVDCDVCYSSRPVSFDQTKEEDDGWRITANPLAWGNPNAEVIVLGFSKGPTQAGALASAPHDDIAYKGSRLNVGKIMAHVGLVDKLPNEAMKRKVDDLISDRDGQFHFASLIRCTVERFDPKTSSWKGSGGGMLDKFVASSLGRRVATTCTKKYLADLPSATRLILMFGMGSKQNYVRETYALYKAARPGDWRRINDVAYTDGKITVVHVEHFASQGALIPNWLGENDHERSKLGQMAQAAVASAMG